MSLNIFENKIGSVVYYPIKTQLSEKKLENASPKYFSYGTGIRLKFFKRAVLEKIIDHSGNVKDKSAMDALSFQVIKKIYDELFDPCEIVIGIDKTIKISIGEILFTFLSLKDELKKLNVQVPDIHYVGGFVCYILFYKDPEYVKKLLKKINSELVEVFDDSLLRPGRIPPPDKDIRTQLIDPRFSIDQQGLQRGDFFKIYDIILGIVVKKYISKHGPCDESCLLEDLKKNSQLNKNPILDLGITRFLMVFFKNSDFQLIFSNTLYRHNVFNLDALYLSIEKLILLGPEAVRIVPQSFENASIQTIFDLLCGLIKGINPDKIDYKGWFRLMSWITKSLCSGQEGLEQLLFNKVLNCIINVPEKGISKFIEELHDWLVEHHPNDAYATFAYLFNCVSFLCGRVQETHVHTILNSFKLLPFNKKVAASGTVFIEALNQHNHCSGQQLLIELYQLLIFNEVQIPFSFLYAFLDLFLFYSVSREKTLLDDSCSIELEHHEFSFAVYKLNVFWEGRVYSLQIKVDPIKSVLFFLKQKEENPKWDEYERLLLPFILKYSPLNVKKEISKDFVSKLVDLEISEDQMNLSFSKLADSSSVLLSYFSFLLLDNTNDSFDSEIQSIFSEAYENKHDIFEIKNNLVRRYFTLKDKRSVEKGYKLWSSSVIDVSKSFLRISLGYISSLIISYPEIVENMLSLLSSKNAFKIIEKEDFASLEKVLVSGKEVLTYSPSSNVIFCNITIRLLKIFSKMVSVFKDQETTYIQKIAKNYLWLIIQATLQNNLEIVKKAIDIAIENQLFTKSVLITLFKKIEETSPSQAYYLWKEVISKYVSVEKMFPSLISVASHLEKEEDFADCLHLIEQQILLHKNFSQQVDELRFIKFSKEIDKQVHVVIKQRAQKEYFFYNPNYLEKLDIHIAKTLVRRGNYQEAIDYIERIKCLDIEQIDPLFKLLTEHFVLKEQYLTKLESLFIHFANKNLLKTETVITYYVFFVQKFLENQKKSISAKNCYFNHDLHTILINSLQRTQNIDDFTVIANAVIIFFPDSKLPVKKNHQEKIMELLVARICLETHKKLCYSLQEICFNNNLNISLGKENAFFWIWTLNNLILDNLDLKLIEKFYKYGESRGFFKLKGNEKEIVRFAQLIFPKWQVNEDSANLFQFFLNDFVELEFDESIHHEVDQLISSGIDFVKKQTNFANSIRIFEKIYSLKLSFQKTIISELLDLFSTTLKLEEVLTSIRYLIKKDVFFTHDQKQIEAVVEGLIEKSFIFNGFDYSITTKLIFKYLQIFKNKNVDYWENFLLKLMDVAPHLVWNFINNLEKEEILSDADLEKLRIIGLKSLSKTYSPLLIDFLRKESCFDESFKDDSNRFEARCVFFFGICQFAENIKDFNERHRLLLEIWAAFEKFEKKFSPEPKLLEIGTLFDEKDSEDEIIDKLAPYDFNRHLLFQCQSDFKDFTLIAAWKKSLVAFDRAYTIEKQKIVEIEMEILYQFLACKIEVSVIKGKKLLDSLIKRFLPLSNWKDIVKIINLLSSEAYSNLKSEYFSLILVLDKLKNQQIDYIKIINHILFIKNDADSIFINTGYSGFYQLITSEEIIKTCYRRIGTVFDAAFSNPSYRICASTWKLLYKVFDDIYTENCRRRSYNLFCFTFLKRIEENKIAFSCVDEDFHVQYQLCVLRTLSLQDALKDSKEIFKQLNKVYEKLTNLHCQMEIIPKIFSAAFELIIKIGSYDIEAFKKYCNKFLNLISFDKGKELFFQKEVCFELRYDFLIQLITFINAENYLLFMDYLYPRLVHFFEEFHYKKDKLLVLIDEFKLIICVLPTRKYESWMMELVKIAKLEKMLEVQKTEIIKSIIQRMKISFSLLENNFYESKLREAVSSYLSYENQLIEYMPKEAFSAFHKILKFLYVHPECSLSFYEKFVLEIGTKTVDQKSIIHIIRFIRFRIFEALLNHISNVSDQATITTLMNLLIKFFQKNLKDSIFKDDPLKLIFCLKLFIPLLVVHKTHDSFNVYDYLSELETAFCRGLEKNMVVKTFSNRLGAFWSELNSENSSVKKEEDIQSFPNITLKSIETELIRTIPKGLLN